MGRQPGAKDKKPRKKREDGNKPAWSKSPIINDAKAELPDGYNTKMIQFMMDIAPQMPIDLWDVDAMQERFVRYLEICAERDIKVGNQAAYYAIGISKEIVGDWLRQDPNGRNARTNFIKKVQQICAMYREGLMQDGKVNPVTGIFWQKNYDGLKDQQETIITPNNPLGDATDTEALRRRYLEQKEVQALPETQKEGIPEVAESVPVDPDKSDE
jgi:hypothetical protein